MKPPNTSRPAIKLKLNFLRQAHFNRPAIDNENERSKVLHCRPCSIYDSSSGTWIPNSTTLLSSFREAGTNGCLDRNLSWQAYEV